MANHQISLPQRHTDILKKMKADYGLSASEAVRRGLEMLEEKEAERNAKVTP